MRDKIIAAIRKAGLENAKAFAEIAHNETGMGRVSDKIAKNILVCERTPGTECLSPMAISGDMGLTLIENAPWGVIASVTPSTNPTATVINNAISMIAGGNSVIFAPHPNAKRASQTAIQVLNKAIIEATGVANLLVAVKEPTIEVAQELFSHPRIKLLVVTGGEAVVAQARKVATMRLIAAGAGNPPVVVDETANIARAARSIYDGASFDNNIICADEKEIIAVDSIADIIAIAVAADDLAPDGVVVSDLPCGYGTVRCQHGLIPVPAPATAFIAEAAGLTLSPVDVEGELVTPTGAAAAAALRTEAALPERFSIKAIGMGAGKRAYDTPGILRAMIIEEEEEEKTDGLELLETNLDDCIGEALGYTMNLLLKAGANDVWYTPKLTFLVTF